MIKRESDISGLVVLIACADTYFGTIAKWPTRVWKQKNSRPQMRVSRRKGNNTSGAFQGKLKGALPLVCLFSPSSLSSSGAVGNRVRE